MEKPRKFILSKDSCGNIIVEGPEFKVTELIEVIDQEAYDKVVKCLNLVCWCKGETRTQAAEICEVCTILEELGELK